MFGSDSSHLVVLLASVLKPVNDTRMRGKFVKTLFERPYMQLHVAGRDPGGDLNFDPNEGFPRICHHSIFWGSRLSLNRLRAQAQYWRLLRVLRPDLVIVHAPELLPLTLLWQWLGKGRKFLYDIRENYALNVTTQRVYQGFVRRGLAIGLRWVETQAARHAVGLILAETSYADELPFLTELPANRVIVLENKYQPVLNEVLPTHLRPRPPLTEPVQLLFSGTISEVNGVWEAIALAEQLHQAWPGGAHLTIIGFCQQSELLRSLQARVAAHPTWLTLIGGAELVPHERIVAEIGRSHIGLLAYRPHASTERCRPTKLFEYLAHGLPIIATPNPLWQLLLVKYGAGLQLDLVLPINVPVLVEQLKHAVFYPRGVPSDVLWAEEGKKLWHLLDSLI